VESSPKNDTIYYWLRDTTLVNQDTLNIEAQYMMTDTSGVLVSKTDTMEFIAKTPYEKRVKAKEKEYEKWLKEQEKKKKKGSSYDSIMPRKFLQLRISPSGSIDPYSRIVIESPTPLQQIDTAGIHLATKVDSLFVPLRYTFRQHPDNIRQYVLTAPWQLGAEYSLDIDSAAVTDIYDHTSEFSPEDIANNKLYAILMYCVSLMGIIIGLLAAGDSPYVRFHVKQSLKLFICEVLLIRIDFEKHRATQSVMGFVVDRISDSEIVSGNVVQEVFVDLLRRVADCILDVFHDIFRETPAQQDV
jgi:uncharacterized membrane protein